MALARQVTAGGYGDGPWEAVGRDGKRRLFGPSLHRLARLTIQENDRIGPRLEQFQPFDQAIPRDRRNTPMGVHRRGVEAPSPKPAA